jgi:signal transduction histidine kinase
MPWPIARRSRNVGIYLTLAVLAAGASGWQWGEHQRFKQAAAQALINRGRDITSTLGIVVSSQRRVGNLVAKDRIESALHGLIHPGELESIAILGATGETIASAGRPVELTTEMVQGRGVYWRERELILMNLMDLGVGGVPEGDPRSTTLVVSSAQMGKALRPALRASGALRPTENRPAVPVGEAAATGAPAPGRPGRVPFSRPSWMSEEEYNALIRKQGVHSLVISLSTDELRRSVRNDLWLRTLISALASGAAIISGLAWRNVARNAELQIRLVKAGEMNSHLAEMNFAAAGLAHETRNPLNLIRGLAQMIAMQAEAPKLREHASAIIEEADRVTVQLNEFIDYSKPREAHLTPVDVARVVADVIRTLMPDIEDKQIRLQPPAQPFMVEADEQLFRQALFNLLLNAVQAVDPGGQVEVRGALGPDGWATIEIRDDGPGVPEAERRNIFKPYVTMRPKGVGLGLAIVHQIAAAHHWEIACLANEPRGALFRIQHVKPAAPRHES